MALDSNAELKRDVEDRLRRMQQAVNDLEAEISKLNEKLTRERHRLDVTGEFFRLEFENNGNLNLQGAETPLFNIPQRFEQGTIRSACRDLLQQNGPMHVADLHTAITTGGRTVTKTSITSTLIRGDEFGRVEGRPNTFRLVQD